jgi:cardiolipin synthase
MDRELIERSREAGAAVQWFRPPRWYTLDKANNRLHRRLLIVDGSVGFTGGVGVGESGRVTPRIPSTGARRICGAGSGGS